MKKAVFILFLIFISPSALCCAFPNSGPEFDKLIEVIKLDGVGNFRVEIPRFSSPKKPEIYIETYTIESYELLTNGPVKKRLEAGESVSGEEYDREWAASRPEKTKEIWWLKTENNRVFKEISVRLKQGFVHRVHAYWPVECCLCSTYAFSKPLESL